MPDHQKIQQLAFLWTSFRSRNRYLCRGLVHDGPHHCFQQFIIKLIHTGRVASKYYIMVHLIPLALRLRRTKQRRKISQQIMKTFVEYLKSICFLSFLVGLLRAGLCINWNQKQPNILPLVGPLLIFSPISALSIFFEDRSRRGEVACYVFGKSIRSVYLILKRTYGWNWSGEGECMHIAMLSMLYYVHNHKPEMLKFRNLLQLILGDE